MTTQNKITQEQIDFILNNAEKPARLTISKLFSIIAIAEKLGVVAQLLKDQPHKLAFC